MKILDALQFSDHTDDYGNLVITGRVEFENSEVISRVALRNSAFDIAGQVRDRMRHMWQRTVFGELEGKLQVSMQAVMQIGSAPLGPDSAVHEAAISLLRQILDDISAK